MSVKKTWWPIRHTADTHGDIRYQGPLSYRIIKILGWLCVLVSTVVGLLSLTMKISPEMEKGLRSLWQTLYYVSSLALPLLVIQGISRIMRGRGEYWQQLLTYGGFACCIIAIYGIIYQSTVLRLIDTLFLEPKMALPIIEKYIEGFGEKGFINFNIFVDIFLCFLIFFFLTVQPKRVFTGKWVLILRFLTILPVGWVIACMILKGQGVAGKAVLPFWLFPFLTTRPLPVYLLFLFLSFQVRKENLFSYSNISDDLITLPPRRRSFRFAVLLAVSLAAAGILDYLLQFVAAKFFLHAPESVAAADAFDWGMRAAMNIGLGGDSLALLILAPVMLLYSFTRVPKWRYTSILVPLAAIGLLILMWSVRVPETDNTYIVQNAVPKISIVRLKELLDKAQQSYSASLALIQ